MDDEFPRELEQLRRQHFKDYPHRPMNYGPALVARIVSYLWERRLRCETIAQCSEKLGLSTGQLRRWMGSVSAPPPASVPKPPPAPFLRPVQVSALQVPVFDGVPEPRYTVRSPSGFAVNDLRWQELVVLLRSLL